MKNSLLYDILNDMRVELAEEIDKNFQEGAFFGNPWKNRSDGSKSRLQISTNLRKSVNTSVRSNSVVVSSSMPYASIHNDGGDIVVTSKMRSYFWAKFYAAGGGNSAKAQQYKAMALKPIGSKIHIPQRQFIGDHPHIRKCIEEIIYTNVERHVGDIATKLIKK